MVGAREGRGRDDLTDEIARKKEREGGRPPTQNNVPQRQRHPCAVGQPSTRKVSSQTVFFIVCFLFLRLASCFPVARCCSLDGLAEREAISSLPRMELNEPPCLLAIPPPPSRASAACLAQRCVSLSFSTPLGAVRPCTPGSLAPYLCSYSVESGNGRKQ